MFIKFYYIDCVTIIILNYDLKIILDRSIADLKIYLGLMLLTLTYMESVFIKLERLEASLNLKIKL